MYRLINLSFSRGEAIYRVKFDVGFRKLLDKDFRRVGIRRRGVLREGELWRRA
jgi:hypothetical protein